MAPFDGVFHQSPFWHLDAVRGPSTPSFELPAVKSGRVYAVDANSYFARPGPRVVEGTELLAHLLHPSIFEWHGPSDAFLTLKPGPAPGHRGSDAVPTVMNS